MGVRHLNKYITSNCSGIQSIELSSLSNKKIVIDTSIYLYKYKSLGLLLINMEKMIKLFSKFSICPIFVFDGKPSDLKQPTLDNRKEKKKEAWEKYKELSKTIPEESLVYLKPQFTKVSKLDIFQVKKIMDSFGANYIDAPNEADEICAMLMLTNQVYACMSDDMDMFIYGCVRIIRNVNIDSNTADMYNLDIILDSLRMTMHEFRQVCVISGTDYYSSSQTLFDYIKLFNQYKRTSFSDFYDWLYFMGKIKNKNKLMSSFNMFILQEQSLELLELTSESADSCTSAN
jgi:5'-3' exonuclease